MWTLITLTQCAQALPPVCGQASEEDVDAGVCASRALRRIAETAGGGEGGRGNAKTRLSTPTSVAFSHLKVLLDDEALITARKALESLRASNPARATIAENLLAFVRAFVRGGAAPAPAGKQKSPAKDADARAASPSKRALAVACAELLPAVAYFHFESRRSRGGKNRTRNRSALCVSALRTIGVVASASTKAAAYVAEVRSIHWSPYDRVGVVNADP